MRLLPRTLENTIIIKSDPAVDRKWGPGTSVGFSNINVRIDLIPFINFLSIEPQLRPISTRNDA